ncbi:MAG: N-acetyltransferase [Ruminococcaceae bacterium]|nr:N-acetyltransferase [Oscillospiraceae bacterium]
MSENYIRPAEERDLPAILAIYAPYVLHTTYSFEYTVPTLPVFTERYRGITESYPWLVWEEDGAVIGYAYASRMFERTAYQWSADISIYIMDGHHGKGIGRRLYAEVEAVLVKCGYQKVYAIITEENRDSCAFHECVGYKKEGMLHHCGYKFGRWLGVNWYGKQLVEGEPEGDPIPWDGRLFDGCKKRKLEI